MVTTHAATAPVAPPSWSLHPLGAPVGMAGPALSHGRRAAGVPISALALESGVSRHTLARLEAGRERVLPSTMARLYLALGALVERALLATEPPEVKAGREQTAAARRVLAAQRQRAAQAQAQQAQTDAA